jgi:hypothetical protein
MTDPEKDCQRSRTQADSETVWAAFVFAVGSPTAIGAIRASKRLHRTKIEARREAERWAEDMRLGPLRWEIVDDPITGWALWRPRGSFTQHPITRLTSQHLLGQRPPDPTAGLTFREKYNLLTLHQARLLV